MAHITIGVDVGKASHRAAAYDPATGGHRAQDPRDHLRHPEDGPRLRPAYAARRTASRGAVA